MRPSVNWPRGRLAGREISAPEPAHDSKRVGHSRLAGVVASATQTLEDDADFELFRMSQIAPLFHRTKREIELIAKNSPHLLAKIH
jgi:hypothetical protein